MTSAAHFDRRPHPQLPEQDRAYAARALDDLALRARDGDAAAEAELIGRLRETMQPLVTWRIFMRKNWALAEHDIDDAVHDLILKVWEHDLPVFDPKKSGFLTFLSRRIDWHLADRARENLRDRGEEIDDEELEEIVDLDRDPESLLEQAENEKDLLAVPVFVKAHAGDETASTVLSRHDLGGATLLEVARELDIHVSNACRARQRGLKRLQRAAFALAA